jgi:hypothetical protein
MIYSIEEQAFLQSYDSAYFHYLPPPRQQLVSLSQSSCVSLVNLNDGRGGGRGAKS